MFLRIVLFGLVWIPASVLVFGFYLVRKRPSWEAVKMAYLLTSLVRQSVWERLVLRKEETKAALLAERRVENFVKQNPYTTRKR